jgi:hypothetical protein
MLQILVYIQALVLNAKPYFNEPGHAAYANTPGGEKQSLLYNEETFLLSCRTMLYSLRNPPNVLRSPLHEDGDVSERALVTDDSQEISVRESETAESEKCTGSSDKISELE